MLRRVVWFLVGVLAVLTVALSMGRAAERTHDRAPVVIPLDEGAMKQIGWYTYEREKDTLVLYCVKHRGHVLLDCVVFVRTEDGTGIVLVTGVVPSEVES